MYQISNNPSDIMNLLEDGEMVVVMSSDGYNFAGKFISILLWVHKKSLEVRLNWYTRGIYDYRKSNYNINFRFPQFTKSYKHPIEINFERAKSIGLDKLHTLYDTNMDNDVYKTFYILSETLKRNYCYVVPDMLEIERRFISKEISSLMYFLNLEKRFDGVEKDLDGSVKWKEKKKRKISHTK